ncbi:hypothetical protein K402DRAFT_144683 [Aulographum hederae CBS 113979]|uniref:Uncharacterized protein n=1 Tax=Aulographum hederae CBS 113979 TaxID=1176131 RepID=A0A6G1GUQ2_9PEZI|nr:hypothetical protein K402DRAFT_144683 [Aulographum hederae CBS 113979]
MLPCPVVHRLYPPPTSVFQISLLTNAISTSSSITCHFRPRCSETTANLSPCMHYSLWSCLDWLVPPTSARLRYDAPSFGVDSPRPRNALLLLNLLHLIFNLLCQQNMLTKLRANPGPFPRSPSTPSYPPQHPCFDCGRRCVPDFHSRLTGTHFPQFPA